LRFVYLAYYESLQDKLGQLKDAREALNALREEHLENKKRQALERERQRQMQLAVKLDDMRQKKHVKSIFFKEIKLRKTLLGVFGISKTTSFTAPCGTRSRNASKT
jgi:hypothetical protein